jgi:hypothetical protein
MPAFRSVVSVLLRELGDFSLHPQDPGGEDLVAHPRAKLTWRAGGCRRNPRLPTDLVVDCVASAICYGPARVGLAQNYKAQPTDFELGLA